VIIKLKVVQQELGRRGGPDEARADDYRGSRRVGQLQRVPGAVRSVMGPDHGTPGNGLLLFFRVDDFDLALQRTRSLVTRLEEEPHVNPNIQTRSARSEIRTDITLRSALSAA